MRYIWAVAILAALSVLSGCSTTRNPGYFLSTTTPTSATATPAATSTANPQTCPVTAVNGYPVVLCAVAQTVGTGTAQLPNLVGTTDSIVFSTLAATLYNKTINGLRVVDRIITTDGVPAQAYLLNDGLGNTAFPFLIDEYSGGNSTNNTPAIISRYAWGTKTSPIALPANEIMLNLGSRGYDGTAFTTLTKANVQILTVEPWSTTNQGTAIVFATTAIGTTSRSQRWSISSTGVLDYISTEPSALVAPGTIISSGIAFGADNADYLLSRTSSGSGTTRLYIGNKKLAVESDALSFFASTSSAALRGIMSDSVGTGSLVFANAPTLTGGFTESGLGTFKNNADSSYDGIYIDSGSTSSQNAVMRFVDRGAAAFAWYKDSGAVGASTIRLYANNLGTDIFSVSDSTGLFSSAYASAWTGGVGIGSSAANNLISTSSGGTGSTTLYIGNSAIAVIPSDERLKENVRTVPNETEKLRSLTALLVDVDWTEGRKLPNTTILAQELDKIFPEFVVHPAEQWIPYPTGFNGPAKRYIYKGVSYTPDDAVMHEGVLSIYDKNSNSLLGINYPAMVPYLLKGWGELDARLTLLEGGGR